MKQDAQYESCNYYACKGNEVAKEFFTKQYGKLNPQYIEPEDNHCVYDLQMDIDHNGTKIHYYIEVKLKFNKHFFDDYTYITAKKYREIREFMKNKDPKIERYLYLNYYPMNEYLVLFNLTETQAYDYTYIDNYNATANETDIEPYLTKVQMCMLPMKHNEQFKMFRHSTDIEIKYNGRTWQHGRMI